MPRSGVVRRQGLEPRTRGLRVGLAAVGDRSRNRSVAIHAGQAPEGPSTTIVASAWSVYGEPIVNS
jgi:hypothetical protein